LSQAGSGKPRQIEQSFRRQKIQAAGHFFTDTALHRSPAADQDVKGLDFQGTGWPMGYPDWGGEKRHVASAERDLPWSPEATLSDGREWPKPLASAAESRRV